MSEWTAVKKGKGKLVRFQKISGKRTRIVIHESVLKEASIRLGQLVDVMFDSTTKPTKMRICSGTEHVLTRDPQAARGNNNGATDLKLGFDNPKSSSNYTASGGVIDVKL